MQEPTFVPRGKCQEIDGEIFFNCLLTSFCFVDFFFVWLVTASYYLMKNAITLQDVFQNEIWFQIQKLATGYAANI